MAQQIDQSTALGKFLQKVYSDGITNTISEEHLEWEMVNKLRVSDQAARSVDFMVNTSFGPAAVQWAKQGGAKLPRGSQTSNKEGSAGFNQMYTTIELEGDLWERAKTAKSYLEPLAHEIRNKAVAQKRELSATFHLDGSGVYGTVSSVVTNGNEATITLASGDADKGGERYINYGDVVKFADATGALRNDVTDTEFVVIDKDRKANTITIQRDDEDNFTDLDAAAADLVYRRDADVLTTTDAAYNLAGSDWNDRSTQMCGLETLTARDGRKIHNLPLSGTYKGQHFDAEEAPVDITQLQSALDDIKTRNGSGFKYSQILAAPETNSAFINSNEQDRRLVSASDKERGFAGFCFLHGKDKLEMVTSEYTGASRMWVIPDGKAAGGCLELHGKDFQDIKIGGGEYLRQASGGGYEDVVQKFMRGYMTMICKRPGAILKIHNFKV